MKTYKMEFSVQHGAEAAMKLYYIYQSVANRSTLASGIDVGPTFNNFGFLSRPYSLIREYIDVI